MLEESLRSWIRLGKVLLWQVDGEPVSMACLAAPVFGVGRIGSVHTPWDLAGHGYATSVAVAATRQGFADGARVMSFVTEQNDARRDGIRRRLGYEERTRIAVVDFVEG